VAHNDMQSVISTSNIVISNSRKHFELHNDVHHKTVSAVYSVSHHETVAHDDVQLVTSITTASNSISRHHLAAHDDLYHVNTSSASPTFIVVHDDVQRGQPIDSVPNLRVRSPCRKPK
jgi:hypothetical protein